MSVVRSAVACVLALVLTCSCGLPDDAQARRLDDDGIPYRLLEQEGSPSASPTDGGPPGAVPSVFWLLEDLLVPARTDASCADDPAEVVRLVLDLLAAGPPDDERAAGRSTAIPPESDLSLVALQDGTATVGIGTDTEISADRLPAAVGQIALAVTSVPGVVLVRFDDDGGALPVPLPGGALTTEPVRRADYRELLPARLRGDPGPGCPEA